MLRLARYLFTRITPKHSQYIWHILKIANDFGEFLANWGNIYEAKLI